MFKFCVPSSLPVSCIKQCLCISVSLIVLACVLILVGASCTLIGQSGGPCGEETIFTVFGLSGVFIGSGIAFAVLHSRLKGSDEGRISDERVGDPMIEEEKEELALPLTEVDGYVETEDEETINAVSYWIEQQTESMDNEIPYINEDSLRFAVSAESDEDRIYERAISIDRESYS